MRRSFALALFLVPALAFAQDGNSHKFDAKRLEKDFAPLPLFTKGGVALNEVVVSKDQVKDALRAVYVVKADPMKVLEFYKEKLSVEPVKSGDEALGDVRYTLNLPGKQGDVRIFRVVLAPLSKKSTQVSLYNRAVTDDDDLSED